jgi:hypothetical protein
MVAKKPVNPLKAGDRVRILHSDNWHGRIVEERGPLGPGGMLVFRVRIPRKPKPTFIEVCEDQLVAMPKPPEVGPSTLITTPRPKLKPPNINVKPRRPANGRSEKLGP